MDIVTFALGVQGWLKHCWPSLERLTWVCDMIYVYYSVPTVYAVITPFGCLELISKIVNNAQFKRLKYQEACYIRMCICVINRNDDLKEMINRMMGFLCRKNIQEMRILDVFSYKPVFIMAVICTSCPKQ